MARNKSGLVGLKMYLKLSQHEHLQSEATKNTISVSELVRQIIDEHYSIKNIMSINIEELSDLISKNISQKLLSRISI